MTDKTEQAGTPARRMSLGLRVVFFLSLAVNLGIAGVVAGFVWNGGPREGMPRNARDAVAPYTQALRREDRQDIGRKLFRDMRAEGSRDEMRARVRAEYQEALGLLRAEPFDVDAFSAVLQRQNERAAARQARGQAALVAHVAAMSVDDRAAFADRVAEALEHGGRKRK
ncbi:MULTISPECIES: periplasmic heavy metal sensor [unclassified Marinovum]